MTSSIRQIAFLDPVTSNTIDIVGTGFILPFPLATLPGSTIVALGTLNNGSGTTVTGINDTVNGAYTILDHYTDAGNQDNLSAYFPNAAALSAGDKGQVNSGSTTTIQDPTKTWTVNQWAGLTVRNRTNGTSAVVTSNTANILTFPAMGSANALGNFYSVGDQVNIVLSGFNDYNAACILEVTGVTASSLAGHNAQLQTVGAAGTDNLSSLTAACGSAPVIVVGFSANIGGASSPFVPNVGTGFTSEGTSWAFDLGQVVLRVEFKNVSNPGTTGATFSAQGADRFATAFVALSDSGGAVATPQYPWQLRGGMGVHVAS